MCESLDTLVSSFKTLALRTCLICLTSLGRLVFKGSGSESRTGSTLSIINIVHGEAVWTFWNTKRALAARHIQCLATRIE